MSQLEERLHIALHSAGPSAPEIVETNVEMSEETSIYSCEATGIPIPTITWTAVNQNGDTVSLTDALNGVSIESDIDNLEFTVSSELTTLQSSRFRMPICIATNLIGMDEEEITNDGMNPLRYYIDLRSYLLWYIICTRV